ncbi:MAG: hypothetical protein AAGB19_22300 [Cyanobacteria bacterium P01_F01_bin.3]
MNKHWEHLVQSNGNAMQFAGRIWRLADRFSRLKSPGIKSMADVQDKFIADVHRSLRSFLQIAHAFDKGSE